MNRIHPEIIEQIERLLEAVGIDALSSAGVEAAKLRRLMEKHVWKGNDESA